MSDTAPLTVGVLGYRFMGRAHANALARLPMFFPDAPTVERHTLVGQDETALANAADRLGFAHTATDWREVIDAVDIFYNLGPNDLHPDPLIAALEANTPVLCEKPLAPTLRAAEGMHDAAATRDAVAGCGFNYRFVPAIQYAKRLIADGALGTIRQVRGRYLQDWFVDPGAAWSWRNDQDRAGSGALGDLGAHTIDFVRFLVGDNAGDITRVAGHLRTFTDERPVPDSDERRPVTVDDAYTAQVAFDSGAVGTPEASRVAPGHNNDHTIEIHGKAGSLRFSLQRLNELEYTHEDHRGYETILVTEESDPYIDYWWPPGHVVGWEHTFVHENYEFLRGIAAGELSASFPGFHDGLAVQRVLDAIQRSDEQGAWVGV